MNEVFLDTRAVRVGGLGRGQFLCLSLQRNISKGLDGGHCRGGLGISGSTFMPDCLTMGNNGLQLSYLLNEKNNLYSYHDD